MTPAVVVQKEPHPIQMSLFEISTTCASTPLWMILLEKTFMFD
jgi:hypothetical protein